MCSYGVAENGNRKLGKEPKLYKILYHIESCGTCMKY